MRPGWRLRPGRARSDWRMARLPSPPGSALARLQPQRARVDAVAQPRRRRAVVEYVAEMAAATATAHLGPDHPVAGVAVQRDVLGDRRLVEARPAATRLELRLRAEQLRAAASAVVAAVRLDVEILAAERRLGPVPPQHLVLLGGQPRAPLLVAQLDRRGLCLAALHSSHRIAARDQMLWRPTEEPSVRANRRARSVPRRPRQGCGPIAHGCQPSVPYSSRTSALSSPRCCPQA